MRTFILFMSLLVLSAHAFTTPAGAVALDEKKVAVHVTLRFRFLTPSGKPNANTVIQYMPGRPMVNAAVITDTKGIGEISCENIDIYDEWYFVCYGVGYARLRIDADCGRSDKKPILVHLQTGPFISGRVISEKAGVRLGGIKLYPFRKQDKKDKWQNWNGIFSSVGPNGDYAVDDPMSVTSRDGDGAFSAGPLPPGCYKLVVRDLNTGVTFDLPVDTASQEARRLMIELPVNKELSHKITGRVLRKDMTPIVGKELQIWIRYFYPNGDRPEHWYYYEPVLRRAKTNAKGEFTLYPVFPDAYIFNVLCNGLSAKKRVTVPQKVRRIDFVMKR